MNQILEFGSLVKSGIEEVAGFFAGSLYEGADGSYVWEFLFVTFILGGLAARATGRANASVWQPYLLTFAYVLALGIAVRFLHFALFQRTLLSFPYYLTDEILLQLIAAWSYRATRADQMTSQYRWMFDRSGSTGWIRRAN